MEESIFLEVVGESPTMKILQYLIEGRHFDYTLTDLAENSGVSWGTLHTIFPKLIKHELVTKTRDIGRAKLYKINQENPIAKRLIGLYDYINIANLEKNKEEAIIAQH